MKAKTALLTAALAGITMAASGCASKQAEANSGQCHGVNACKGQGECGGKTHDCGGKNECKGHGWIKTTAEDCQAKSGEFVKEGEKPATEENTEGH